MFTKWVFDPYKIFYYQALDVTTQIYSGLSKNKITRGSIVLIFKMKIKVLMQRNIGFEKNIFTVLKALISLKMKIKWKSMMVTCGR